MDIEKFPGTTDCIGRQAVIIEESADFPSTLP